MDTSTEKSGFFDCLDSIYQAISENRIRKIQQNLPEKLKHLGCINLVEAEGLPQDHAKMTTLCDTVYGGFLSQMDKGEQIDGLNFDYGVADMGNRLYFYFVWPEEKALEAKPIDDYIAKLKDMFKDTHPEGFPEYEKIHLGPFERNDSLLFQKIYERLITFSQHEKIPAGLVESSEGLKTSFEKAAYLSLFENEMGFSPLLKQGQTITHPQQAPRLH